MTQQEEAEQRERECRCDVPNLGLPLVGDELCRSCGKPV